MVALDTPSRATGLYISGGVMAAPTAGAVLADILPYLDVKRTYSEEDAAGQTVVLENMIGMTAKEAEKQLNAQLLTARFVGTGETVTGQIPAAGQSVPGDSQVLLYLGEPTEETVVKVPDFLGMNRQQATDAAGKLGLYILVSGNDEIAPGVTVASQSVAAGSEVPGGTTITLEFMDTRLRD